MSCSSRLGILLDRLPFGECRSESERSSRKKNNLGLSAKQMAYIIMSSESLGKMRNWRNGSRDGFRSRWRNPCGFDSRVPHHIYLKSMIYCYENPIEDKFRGLGLSQELLDAAAQFDACYDHFYDRAQDAFLERCSKFGNPAIANPRNPRNMIIYNASRMVDEDGSSIEDRCFSEEAQMLLLSYPDIYFKTANEAIHVSCSWKRNEMAALTRNFMHWAKNDVWSTGDKITTEGKARYLWKAEQYFEKYEHWCSRLAKLAM